ECESGVEGWSECRAARAACLIRYQLMDQLNRRYLGRWTKPFQSTGQSANSRRVTRPTCGKLRDVTTDRCVMIHTAPYRRYGVNTMAPRRTGPARGGAGEAAQLHDPGTYAAPNRWPPR